MEFSLDKRALAAIDARSLELLSLVSQFEPAKRPEGWVPDIEMKGVVTEKDLLDEPDFGHTTPGGEYISLEFPHEARMYRLADEAYQKLRSVVTQVLKDRAILACVSFRSIESSLRKWVRNRYRGIFSEDFLAFLSSDLLVKVAEFTVWVPIKDLHVQSPLRLGPAELREISAKDVDLFLVEAKNPEVRDEMLRKLSMYRGHAAMIFQIKAERDFAYEKACVLAERILSTLCVFSPSSTIGATHMSTSLWGSERRPQAAAIFLSKDGWQGMTEGARGSRPEVLSLSDGLVARNKVFFRHVHALLSSEDSNQFASEIIDALTIYRRAVSAPDLTERIIYTLIALETLLLRDTNEAVQDNVATRVAFLIGKNVDERRSIIANFKQGYSLRSGFVHHGSLIDEAEKAEKFLAIAWHAIMVLLDSAIRFKNRTELLRYLEDRKLA